MESLRERPSNLYGNAAWTAGQMAGSAASYIREHDTRRMLQDFEILLRRYPAPMLAAAAACGFLVGRLFRNHNV